MALNKTAQLNVAPKIPETEAHFQKKLEQAKAKLALTQKALELFDKEARLTRFTPECDIRKSALEEQVYNLQTEVSRLKLLLSKPKRIS
ncbi:MAG: hypothetical protein ABIH99_03280 [Candidatus Micrarchaeota archaeon]